MRAHKQPPASDSEQEEELTTRRNNLEELTTHMGSSVSVSVSVPECVCV